MSIFRTQTAASSSSQNSKSLELKKDLERLARFAANMVEAHSAVIFIPSSALPSAKAGNSAAASTTNTPDSLIPCGAHTLAPQSLDLKELSSDHGLIGWVSKNRKAIHVSPFERDSRILGIYNADLQLKSCLGVPILTENPGRKSMTPTSGVLLVDSKKAFAFSKIQGKLLEDLGEEISALFRLHSSDQRSSESSNATWDEFLSKGRGFSQATGIDSVTVLRIRTTNFSEIENQLGLASAAKNLDQLYRLVGQALPPHYPTFITPTGELLTIIDSMMTDVYTNKILAISEHPSLRADTRTGLTVEFRARSFTRSEPSGNLEALINLTTFYSDQPRQIETPVEVSTADEPRRRIFQFR